jgi:hypothetical protein
MKMEVVFHGRPNLQRFAETWAALIAAREGLEVVPGSVKVERRSDPPEPSLADREAVKQ